MLLTVAQGIFRPKIKGLVIQRSTMDLPSQFGERIWKLQWICNRIQNYNGSAITFRIYSGAAIIFRSFHRSTISFKNNNGSAVTFRVYKWSAMAFINYHGSTNSFKNNNGSVIAFKTTMDLQSLW